MQSKQIPYKKHILVCINNRETGNSCANSGSEAILNKLKGYTRVNNISHLVRVSQAKCLGHCSIGPTVMVYPDNLLYHNVSIDDADLIIIEHMSKYVNQ